MFRYRPNGVLVCSPTGLQSIYGSKSNTVRSSWYQCFLRNNESENILSARSKAAHSRKRRALNMAFTDKALRSAEPYALNHITRWFELIMQQSRCGGSEWTEPINMNEWSDHLFFDIMGELCFGKNFNLKEPEANPWKAIPDVIVSSTKVLNAVSPKESSFPRNHANILDWTVSIHRVLGMG